MLLYKSMNQLYGYPYSLPLEAPSPPSPQSHTPLDHHRAQSWGLFVIEQVSTSYLFYTWCIFQCYPLNLSHPLLPLLCPHVYSLFLCPYSCIISTIFLEGICLWSSTTGDLIKDKDIPHSLPPPHSYYTSLTGQCQGHWVKLPNLHNKKLGDFSIHRTLKSHTYWIDCHRRKQKLFLSRLWFYTTARHRSHTVIVIIINSYTAFRTCDMF